MLVIVELELTMIGKSHCMYTRQMAKCACICLVEASLVEASLGSGLNVYALELCSPLFRISSACSNHSRKYGIYLLLYSEYVDWLLSRALHFIVRYYEHVGVLSLLTADSSDYSTISNHECIELYMHPI